MNKYITLEQNSVKFAMTIGGRDWDKLNQCWVNRTPLTFDEACERFPEIVSEHEGRIPFPRWGHAHYIKGDDGMPDLLAENWDTSG